jgi:hypothetical protein
MPAATDQQVQQFVNERLRPRAEQIRALLLAMEDDKSAIDDVYAALTAQSPTWDDEHDGNPPHLLSVNDVLALNTFWTNLIAAMRDDPQIPIVLKACVRPVNS